MQFKIEKEEWNTSMNKEYNELIHLLKLRTIVRMHAIKHLCQWYLPYRASCRVFRECFARKCFAAGQAINVVMTRVLSMAIQFSRRREEFLGVRNLINCSPRYLACNDWAYFSILANVCSSDFEIIMLKAIEIIHRMQVNYK